MTNDAPTTPGISAPDGIRMPGAEPPPPPPPAPTRAVSSAAPVGKTISIPKVEYRPVDTKTYWIGVLPSCPVDHVACGGVTFQKQTVTRNPLAQEDVGMADFPSYPRPGGYAHLSDADVNVILERIARLGIHVGYDENGSMIRASVDRLMPGMIPAACYCWIAEINPDDDIGRLAPPTTLCPMPDAN